MSDMTEEERATTMCDLMEEIRRKGLEESLVKRRDDPQYAQRSRPIDENHANFKVDGRPDPRPRAEGRPRGRVSALPSARSIALRDFFLPV